MADTEKLRNMLDNIIDDKNEQAQVDFHDFLSSKMREVIGVDAATDTNTTTDTNEE